MAATTIQYQFFHNDFIVTRMLQSGSRTIPHSVRASERDLRAIGDGSIDNLIENAKLNPSQSHRLPSLKARGKSGRFGGFVFA